MCSPTGTLLALLLLSLPLASCGPSTPARQVADDQDITRDILWDLRRDSRMAAVRVTCVDRVVTLEGSVPDRPALDEAVQRAQHVAGVGTRVVSSLVIRAR